MRMTKMQDDALDRLFAEAAANPPAPSAELMDRVLADGLALQPARPVPARVSSPPGPGVLARLAALLGGPPALAGVTAAAFLGIAVGYLNPDAAENLAGGLMASGTEEFFPSVDFLTTEG